MEIRPRRLACTRNLPDSHRRIRGLDPSQDRKAALVLNLVSVPLFTVVTAPLKPDIVSLHMLKKHSVGSPVLYVDLRCAAARVTLLHEAVHGVFFWVLTRTKPAPDAKLLFKHAEVPDGHIPLNRTIIIGSSVAKTATMYERAKEGEKTDER